MLAYGMLCKLYTSVPASGLLILKEDLIPYIAMVFFKGILYVKFRGTMFSYVVNLRKQMCLTYRYLERIMRIASNILSISTRIDNFQCHSVVTTTRGTGPKAEWPPSQILLFTFSGINQVGDNLEHLLREREREPSYHVRYILYIYVAILDVWGHVHVHSPNYNTFLLQ